MLVERRARHRADPRDRVRAPRRRPGAAARHRHLQRRRGAVDPAALEASRRGARRRARSRSPSSSRTSQVLDAHPAREALGRLGRLRRDAAGPAARCCATPTPRCSSATTRCAPTGTSRRTCSSTTSAPSGRAWTGLPMVYAVWAVRREFAETQPGRRARRRSARSTGRSRYCRAHLDDISEYAARWEPFPRRALPQLLRRAAVPLRAALPRGTDALPRTRRTTSGSSTRVPELAHLRSGRRDAPRPSDADAALAERVASAPSAARRASADAEQALAAARATATCSTSARPPARCAAGSCPSARSPSSSTATSTTPTSASPAAASARSTAPPTTPTPTSSRREELADKVAETIDLDGTAILLQGGMHPDLDIEWYEGMLRDIKADHPASTCTASARPRSCTSRRLSGITTREVLSRLRDAGLDSLPGGGAEILVDRVRGHVSPKKATSDEWLDVMREAHQLDISTTATMMFGGLETRRGARRAHGARARGAGRGGRRRPRRLPRVHPVELPARQHRARRGRVRRQRRVG